MDDLVKKFRNFLKGSPPPAAVGANAVLPPTEEEIAAAKTRICGLLEKKKGQRTAFNEYETRYYLQHCGKEEANVPVGTLVPGAAPTNLSTPMGRKLKLAHNRFKASLAIPIDPMVYPMEPERNLKNIASNLRNLGNLGNLGGGGKRKHKKTQKRRHGRKGKHTRKH